MASTQTETFETHLGEIEAETPECVNCGNKTLAEDAVSIGVRLYDKTCTGKSICNATHETYRETRQLCPHCAKSVLEFYPDSNFIQRGDNIPLLLAGLFGSLVGGALVLLLVIAPMLPTFGIDTLTYLVIIWIHVL